MIDAMFQEGTDKALDDQVQRPRAEPPKTPSWFSGLPGAVTRNLGMGGLESGAALSEVAGAFGDVYGALGTDSAGGMFSTQSEQERKDSEAARRRMLDSQTPYSNGAGDQLRAKAREIMPDPETTGAASQIIGGVVKFGAKAVGYMAAGGPAGPLALGMDEGLNEADRLKQQGVDLPTRSAAGAVAGVVAGASVIAPMTGATALTRFAKGALIGEGSLIAQSAAEKAILQHAGYDKIADTFDPLDPVALGVGLVPGLLGARFGHAPAKPTARGVKPITDMGLAERQALPFNDSRLDAYAIDAANRAGIPPEALLAIKNAGEKSDSTSTSPVGAKGVMQFMPDTWRQYGRGDIADPMNSIDAGARYMGDLIKQYDGDVRAAIAHYNGGTKAGRAVREGGAPPAAETRAYLDRTDRYMHEQAGTEAGRVNAADPEAQAAARVNQVSDALDSYRLTPDDDLAGRSAHQDAVEMAHEQMAAGEPVTVTADVIPPAATRLISESDGQAVHAILDERGQAVGSINTLTKSTFIDGADRATPVLQIHNAGIDDPAAIGHGHGVRAYVELIDHALAEGKQVWSDASVSPSAQHMYDALRRRGYSVEENAARPPSTDADGTKHTRGSFVFKVTAGPESPGARVERLAQAADQVHAARRPAEPPAPKPRPEPAKPDAAAPPEQPKLAGKPTSGQAEPAPGPSQAHLDMATAEIQRINPDLMVQLDGMDAPVRIGDLLERVKEEAADDAKGAKLVEVAAACALRQG